EADAPGSRLLVASEWMAARNEGEVGVRVFGIIVSRGLVVRGLGSVGTLLGLLLRLQPAKSE
ncbi:MAG: hypothetical protein ACK41V_23750, partial [Acidovorax sp.]|uniref:hypothetical protein n=1 Tax=Acidovorax sp. TaxID=1872122 RepID=UPI00391C1D9F